MSDPALIVLQGCDGKLRIRRRQPSSQELQISLVEVLPLVTEIVKAVPRDAHGAALIEQIIAAARTHRPRDRTNAERQRRFRQRRRARQGGVCSGVREKTPA